MKTVTVLLTVVLLLGLVSAGFCQFNETGITSDSLTARWMAMGASGVAAANDTGAIDLNPANLATMNLAPTRGQGPLSWQASLTGGGNSFNEFSARLGCVNPAGGWGAAASYEHASNGWIDDIGQLGLGYQFKNTHLSVGGEYSDWGGGGLISLGGLYQFPMKNLPPIRLGAVWGNITNTWNDGFLNVGVAGDPIPALTLSADVLNVGGSWHDSALVACGAEYRFCQSWALRAGDYNGGFTWGAGYKQNNYALDFAMNNWPDNWFSGDNQWTVTGSVNF